MEISKNPGIYKIINLINNKIYIGSTKNLYYRWFYGHLKMMRKNKHANKHLQSSFNKYGESNFQFEIIEELINDRTILLEREQYYLDFFKSYDKSIGYNKDVLAKSSLGLKRSAESKLKMRLAKLGTTCSDEHKLNVSKALKNSAWLLNKFGKENPFSIPVIQYDLNMNFIKRWECAAEAKRELKFKNGHINSCCNGLRKTANKFIWKYENK